MKKNIRSTMKLISILACASILTFNYALANYAFKKKIKSVCSSYRVSVDASAMDFDSDLFSLTLESNRNNFEMVMLVGYISAGSALKAGMKFDEVLITVNVPLGDGFKLVTKGKVLELNQLMNGKINTSQFVRKIEYL